ncbi:N-acetylmuramoyl-L-alanine amidase [Brassicibacter mesophilus]|uniref:N-acetylmuramoyl-L-alanine amidase n=1 Tax=Brassicibacter mesophilus TaxID=745119 RepID=UPI003D22BC8D
MKLIFIIDKGHRQDTPGKRANGLHEWEFNDDVGNRLKKLLEPYGEVYFTINVPNHPYTEMTAEGRKKNLQYRCDIANQIYDEAKKKYDDAFKVVFISIHANAHSDPKVSGYEIYAYKLGSQAYEIAKSIHEAAKEVLGVGAAIKDRKIKKASFYVLANTKMPAVLVEHEFYTNIEAAEKLKNSSFRDKCAKHIAKGVLKYMGIEYKEATNGTDIIRLSIHGQYEEVEGIFKDGINYVPVRFLEQLGYKISWNQENKIIEINYRKAE